MFSKELEASVKVNLQNYFRKEIRLTGLVPVSGGSINDTYRLETSEGPFFVKSNSSERFPSMFEKEARGLALLREAGELRVPEVLGKGEAGSEAFLVLEYLDSTGKKRSFWEDFGRNLAKLHRLTNESFGLDHDNYMGSLQQSNNYHDQWTDFFREERLEKQLLLAERSGYRDSALRKAFEALYKRLGEIFPEEPPALVHGDLWSGNYMVDNRGDAALIDPAVYFGHREIDLGMSRLFGVFDPAFYSSYHEEYPLQPGWKDRLDICNLYPLMVHVNLFGEGYLGSVRSILLKHGFMH